MPNLISEAASGLEVKVNIAIDIKTAAILAVSLFVAILAAITISNLITTK